MLFHYAIITDLRLLIIFCLFSWDIYLSLSIFFIILNCNSFWIILLCILWTPLNFISNFMTNQTNSCFYCFFELIFSKQFYASVADCLGRSRSFWSITNIPGLHLPLKLLNASFFTNIFTHIFSKRQKSLAFYKYLISRLNWISRLVIFLYFTL